MVNSKPGLRKSGIDKIISDSRLTQRNSATFKIKVAGNNRAGSARTNTNRPITGTFLSTLGGAITGSIGFPVNLATISANTIDLAEYQAGRVVLLGPAGTLNTINGNHFNGEILFLSGTASITHTIGITGNIETLTGSNFSLVGDDTIILMYDELDAKWHQLTNGRSATGDNLGNHTATTTLNLAAQRIDNVKDILFDGTDTGVTSTEYEITAIGGSNIMVYNVPSGKTHRFSVSGSTVLDQDSQKTTFYKGLRYHVNTISSTTTIDATYHVVVATNTSGNPQADLPSASGNPGMELIFYKKNAGGTLILDASGSDQIDDSGTYVLNTQYQTVTIVSNGIDRWMVTAYG